MRRSATNRSGSTAGSGCDGAREVRANDSSRGARTGAVGGDRNSNPAPAGRQLVTGDRAACTTMLRPRLGWACHQPPFTRCLPGAAALSVVPAPAVPPAPGGWRAATVPDCRWPWRSALLGSVLAQRRNQTHRRFTCWNSGDRNGSSACSDTNQSTTPNRGVCDSCVLGGSRERSGSAVTAAEFYNFYYQMRINDLGRRIAEVLQRAAHGPDLVGEALQRGGSTASQVRQLKTGS